MKWIVESKGKGIKRKNRLRVKRQLRQIVLKRDNNVCLCCGSESNLFVDFIIPRTFEGSSLDLDNLQTLCGFCKDSKQFRIRDFLNTQK